jgi:hypothetical protein
MDIKPDYNLLFLLTHVNPGKEEQQVIETIRQVQDWGSWYQVALFNKVVPICYYSLKQLNLNNQLPAAVWMKMEQEALTVRKKNELRNEEAAIFLKQFEIKNIPVVLLKGVAFGETIYHNPFYKRMNDIDILIKKEDISSVYDIYDSLDYFYIGERISGSKKKSDKVSHLSPPFVSRNYACVIGTQWGIKTSLSPYTINYEKIWNRVSPLTFQGIALKTLSPEDNLHHLCLHLGYFKISVRDMMDLYNLLRVYKEQFNWDLFYAIVAESKSENPVYFGLMLSNYCYPLPQAGLFLQRIESRVTSHYKKAVQWKTRSMDVFFHLHSDHIQTIEKAISVFDSTSYFPEKLRYFFKLWKCIMLPPKKEVICMSGLYKPTFFQLLKARITIPFKIFRVIASEIGWILVFLLIMKTWVSLIFSLIKFPFVSRGKSDSSAYARKLGIPFEKLIQLKEQFQ